MCYPYRNEDLVGFFNVDSGGSLELTLASVLSGTSTDDTVVDSTGDAVLHLNVELRKGVVGNDRSFLDISLGGTIDKISDVESLDGLILTNTTVAVGATDSLDMATAFLGTTSVSSLKTHLIIRAIE